MSGIATKESIVDIYIETFKKLEGIIADKDGIISKLKTELTEVKATLPPSNPVIEEVSPKYILAHTNKHPTAWRICHPSIKARACKLNNWIDKTDVISCIKYWKQNHSNDTVSYLNGTIEYRGENMLEKCLSSKEYTDVNNIKILYIAKEVCDNDDTHFYFNLALENTHNGKIALRTLSTKEKDNDYQK